ncbi:MAG: hypothetical protein R3C61_09035 [Bacteroidia bacterium]
MMGGWGFAIVGLGWFNFYYQNQAFDLHFTLPVYPLIFAVSCFVMAEIFAEGKNLLEDKEFIV